ncbi:PP2C family protein-serine/threonine phosphatase [Streptomyces sp. NBC_01190]|uniref:PP2C family protein-serine/threonine phosphatase n=1 Tax=Streptomyces sp. NBC_01190 TaxID=2903767 RepID=UPI003869BBA6|nr:SpoIIE family protein phosphatase [Streptomyces sp. NBC_01190]
MAEVRFAGGVRADGLPAALSDPRRLAAVAATGLLDTGPEDAFDDLARVAATVAGVDRAFITLVDADRSFWKSCVGVDAEGIEERQRPVGESLCSFVVGLGERFVVDDAVNDPRTRDHPSVRPTRIGAWAGYPVRAPGGEVLGTLCVVDRAAHAWTRAELATLDTLARSVGNEIHLRQSLATSRTALQESDALARSLQDSLLPPVLRQVPGLDAAASYLPASGSAGVVGDFYDLFRAQGPWWAMVMGDVCGKGVEAAKVTALARYTLRADAVDHLSPAEILRRLNTAMLAQRSPRFLTATCATFRALPDGVEGTLCLGGHPRALVRRADGGVEELGEFGTLLGVLPEVRLQDTAFRLAPGDLLLLYTDGAIESRGRKATVPNPGRPMFGESDLAAALAGCGGMDAAATIGRLASVLAAHNDGWASDDTALLALRVPITSGPPT